MTESDAFQFEKQIWAGRGEKGALISPCKVARAIKEDGSSQGDNRGYVDIARCFLRLGVRQMVDVGGASRLPRAVQGDSRLAQTWVMNTTPSLFRVNIAFRGPHLDIPCRAWGRYGGSEALAVQVRRMIGGCCVMKEHTYPLSLLWARTILNVDSQA